MPIPQFIVFEGPDGSGTTFHAKRFAERLREDGRDVLLTCEPSEGPIGGTIRSALNTTPLPPPDSLQLLFTADRADHLAREIIPALNAGTTVVCDRFILSTIIYGSSQGLSKEWLETLNRQFREPDLTIVTLPPYSVCRERLERRAENDHFEEGKLAKRIYDAYEQYESEKLFKIDTNGDKEEVSDRIWQHAHSFGSVQPPSSVPLHQEQE